MDDWKHLPFNLIKDFAYGDVSLDELQLHHCYKCKECAGMWAAFKREAQVIKRAKAVRAKAEKDIARLLEENATKSNKRSA